MVLSPMLVLLLVVFLVMLVMGIVKQEFTGSGFWFQLLVGLAILGLFGIAGGH